MRPPPLSRPTARGTAAVEFALLLPLLLTLAFGATELGRAIATFNVLDKSVRDAARHLSEHGAGHTRARSEAKCLAVYGNTACSGAALTRGLTTANVTVCDALSTAADCPDMSLIQTSTSSGEVINLVHVGISGYTFNSAVTWVVPHLNFARISATMRAQL